MSFRDWLAQYNFSKRLTRLEKQMSTLQDAVQKVLDREAALEARVTAHEQRDADAQAALQAQIDDLKANGGDPALIQSLSDVADKMDAFDPLPPA